MLHLDFETRSIVDLIKRGGYNYASDPTTQIVLASYAFDNDPVQRWRRGDPYPFKGYDGPIAAFNAQFERLIWDYIATHDHDWEPVALERWLCVAAQARANALPGALGNCARALQLDHQKDMAGHRLMLKMCRPKTYEPLTWFEGPDDMEKLHCYCDDDVETERAIYQSTRQLSEPEKKYYWEYERINDRGIGVDVEFAESALEYADDEKEFFAEELGRLTASKAHPKGEITSARQFARIKTWLDPRFASGDDPERELEPHERPRISETAKDMMKYYKNGEPKWSLDSATRHNLLALNEEQQGLLSPDVQELIEILHDAGKSSISKYNAIVNRNVDGTVHGLYIMAGAGQTGRGSSTGVQVHNLPRDVMADTQTAIDEFKAFDDKAIDERADAVGGVVYALAQLVRPTFMARGNNVLMWSDWSSIEARALPWLAMDARAQAKLDRFRACDLDKTLPDVYVENAINMKLFLDDGTPNRQTGKVAELSMGFGGGIGAFLAMAKGYGVTVDVATATRIRDTWRAMNPWASDKRTGFWAKLERAAMQAINHPNTEYKVGRLSYLYTPGTLNGLGALWCKLPSGRPLCYPNARIEMVTKPWGARDLSITAIKGVFKPKQGVSEWPRVVLWPGLLAENATQGTCACLLNDTIITSPVPLIGHTHDELLAETEQARRTAALLKKHMEKGPAWAAGLPLFAETGSAKRYKEKGIVA